MKKNEAISKFLCMAMIIVIIFVSLASLFYIFSETKHECSGAAAGQLMTAVFISLFAAFAVHFFVISCDSPVKRRVRLNN